MLAPRCVVFTASNLLGSSPRDLDSTSQALSELARRNIPLVLSSQGTRAQIELIRRKIEHAHPFITEDGGGLFIPDGYFSLRLEGAERRGRYFCVPFGRPLAEIAAAAQEIAKQAGADVVLYTEMSAREIARNTGMSVRDAEASREREFSERFFFAGTAEAAARSFERIAGERKWQLRHSEEPFWEIYSGNDPGKAVHRLMRLYREVLRSRIRSVGIGSSFDDRALLSATDQALFLPAGGKQFDDGLLSTLPKATRIDAAGPTGWNQAVMSVLADL